MSDHTTDEIGAAAALVQRASSPATADELAAADATISRFIEVVLESSVLESSVLEPAEEAPTRRLRALPVPARVAAVVIAATLWSTGIAAAATGHLPDQVQHAVSHTASHVGLSLPDPSDEQTVEATDEHRGSAPGEDDASTSSIAVSTTSPTTTVSSTNGSVAAAATAGGATSTPAGGASTTLAGGTSRGVGPDVNGPAHDGLCNAYLRGLATGHPKNPDAPPWRNLVEGAKEAGQSVETFCGSTTATTTATTVAAAATTASTSSTSSTTNTTAAISTTVEAKGNPHGGGNGNSNAGGAGEGNTHGNGGGNGNGGNGNGGNG